MARARPLAPSVGRPRRTVRPRSKSIWRVSRMLLGQGDDPPCQRGLRMARLRTVSIALATIGLLAAGPTLAGKADAQGQADLRREIGAHDHAGGRLGSHRRTARANAESWTLDGLSLNDVTFYGGIANDIDAVPRHEEEGGASATLLRDDAGAGHRAAVRSSYRVSVGTSLMSIDSIDARGLRRPAGLPLRSQLRGPG